MGSRPARIQRAEDYSSAGEFYFEKKRVNFLKWFDAYQMALWQYCRSLAGASWEADDLAQETWMKVWRISLEKGSSFSVNKSYLYRIANHLWIDRHRKNKAVADSYSAGPSVPVEMQENTVDTESLWMAMETIVNRLPVNQRITLLLIDVFRYTAAETAEMLSTTEGAVKALLHRARTKLRRQQEESEDDHTSREGKREESSQGALLNEQVVYAYLKAFREQNTGALLMLMNESIALDQTPPPVVLKRGQFTRHEKGSHIRDSFHSMTWAAA